MLKMTRTLEQDEIIQKEDQAMLACGVRISVDNYTDFVVGLTVKSFVELVNRNEPRDSQAYVIGVSRDEEDRKRVSRKEYKRRCKEVLKLLKTLEPEQWIPDMIDILEGRQ